LKNLCAFVPLDSHELACRFMCVEKLEGLFIQCPITICSKSFFRKKSEWKSEIKWPIEKCNLARDMCGHGDQPTCR
jgi:hypothetical protein